MENDAWGYGAGNAHIHQHQRYHRVGVFLGSFAQINGDLALAELTAEDVLARLCDMHDGMCCGFFGAVGIGFGAFAVGKVMAGLVINDVVCYIHGIRAVIGGCDAVYGDAVVAQDDIGAFIFFLRLQYAAGAERSNHGGDQNEYPCAFHNRSSR